MKKEREADAKRAEKRQRTGYDPGPVAPDAVSYLDSQTTLLATQFVMPEMTEELSHFMVNFDPKQEQARKDQAKAQRAAQKERQRNLQQMAAQQQSAQEAFEQSRLRQQMAFQQAQISASGMSPGHVGVAPVPGSARAGVEGA